MNKLYDYYTLTMDRFISIDCDAELQLLIISGKPTEEDLKNAWSLIIEEWNSNLNGFKFDEVSYFTRLKQSYQLRYNAITLLITRLLLQYDERLWNELKSLHACYWSTYYDIDVTNSAAYVKALEKALEVNSHYLADIKDAEMQIAEAKKRMQQHDDGGLTDRKYYSRLFAVLSKENHFQLNRKDITVSDFVEFILLLKEKLEKQTQPIRA